MLVQVVLSGEDCHWYIMLPAVDPPVRLRVIEVLAVPDEGEAVAVPELGVEAHGVAPVPLTAILKAEESPPPVIVTFPL
jgi:hypothetical protein